MDRKPGELTDEELAVLADLVGCTLDTHEGRRARAIATAAARKALTEHGVKPKDGLVHSSQTLAWCKGWNACLEAIRKEIPDA